MFFCTLLVYLSLYSNFQNILVDAKVCGDLCYILKKNRITCTKLFFLSTSQWTIELCVKLLDILKPVEVDLDSEGSNRYEALFQSKTVVSYFLRLIF